MEPTYCSILKYTATPCNARQNLMETNPILQGDYVTNLEKAEREAEAAASSLQVIILTSRYPRMFNGISSRFHICMLGRQTHVHTWSTYLEGCLTATRADVEIIYFENF